LSFIQGHKLANNFFNIPVPILHSATLGSAWMTTWYSGSYTMCTHHRPLFDRRRWYEAL